MFRYIIIVWNAKNTSDCGAASDLRRRIQGSQSGWRSALESPGLYVACVDQELSSDTAILVGDSRGVILGTIFQSPAPGYSDVATPIRHLSKCDAEDILRSKGRSLVSNCWGYYVAALHYPENATAVVLRGPVNPLACFHVGQSTLNVFFSHLDDFIDLKVAAVSINWDSITAQVVGGDYLTNETAIKEIESLECGESMECRPNGCLRHVYWDPRSFLEERSPTNFEQASQTTRRAVDYSVGALSSRHDRILVKLSGGLDSSIVLSSLSRTSHKPSITAVNYYSKGSGDERRFARSMAAMVNCRLVERPRNYLLDLRRFLDCNRTARPVLNFTAPDVEMRNIELARELKASAIFDGELGDNIFGSYPSPGALVECFRQSGFGRQFLDVAMDYAVLTRQSLWRTLALTRREALSAFAEPDFSAFGEIRRVLGADRARSAILASIEAEEHSNNVAGRFLHPWFKQSRRIAPGSHALLFGLIAVTSSTYHSPFSCSHDPLRVSPFVSQPLLENALRTPTYMHCKFAQDRAVARTAFADVLPPEILRRGLGKGGPDRWLTEVIANNIEFLREFLLDGILARRRLIDRSKLETVLSPRIAKSTVVAGDIFAKLYIEAWLRAWQRVEALSAGHGERAATVA
jgi:asparagine synthase (glutamine-hydrolysing)